MNSYHWGLVAQRGEGNENHASGKLKMMISMAVVLKTRGFREETIGEVILYDLLGTVK